jgi:hypothetical protein
MKIPFQTKFWAGLKGAKEEMDYFLFVDKQE